MKISESDTAKGYGYGVRHIQITCMCLTKIALIIGRSSLSVAVLAMTDMKRQNDTNITVYQWDKQIQGFILSSFFWGYIAVQIPVGLLTKRFGGKPILLFSLLANGIICALLPTLVQFGGWQIVCACRVLMGLTQACLLPASHTLLGKWLPDQERTTYSGLVFAGTPIGTIIAMPLSGMLAETRMGWTLIFYTISGIMFVTAVIWFFFSANSPRDHRWMTDEEREYIERGLNTSNPQTFRIPWKNIFTAKGMWAVILAQIGCAITLVLLFSDMPTYLEKGLQISLKNSAFLSAIPYLGNLIGNVLSTTIFDKIYNRGYLSLVACRRLFNSIGFIGIGISLSILSLVGPDNKIIAIVTLIAGLTLHGCCTAGFMNIFFRSRCYVKYRHRRHRRPKTFIFLLFTFGVFGMTLLDLSPNYAGVMLSISNFTASVGSVVTPIGTGYILQNDPTDISRWRIVFLIAASVSVIANVGYVSLVSSKRQEWDDSNYDDKQKADPEEIKPAICTEKLK